MKRSEHRISFTKTTLDALEAKPARYFVYDTKVPGLGMQITPTGTKTFYLYRWLDGKPQRIRLGGYPEMSPELARKQANSLNGDIARGINPVTDKQTRAQECADRKRLALGNVLEAYLIAKRNLKASTCKNYRDVLRLYLSDWKDLPIIDITQSQVVERHAALIDQHGGARANLAMRVLSALFNFAAGEYLNPDGTPQITQNPVKRLGQLGSWARVERRQTLVKVAQMPAWWVGVQTLDPTGRDYLMLMMLTGLRREEAAGLRWEHIDLTERTLTVKATKNHGDHTLPTGDYLTALLERRKAYIGDSSVFVFPGQNQRRRVDQSISSSQYYCEKASAASQVAFTAHDLRRSFITVAESLDIPAYALKRLLNHRHERDVTQSYIVLDIERLRGPMQKIETYLLWAMCVESTVPDVVFHQTT
ncbi:MAG TPA: integrase family protein [Candidatus Competibacteraceae bacterium]|nr:integrase family protein [Candidatus Competibacteraceae bacterium]